MARILGVDDEPQMLAAIGRVVERSGHTFVPARNVGEALRILTEGAVDLILTDFQLPGIDGLEFVEMLRRERDETPVIMLTGHATIDHAISAVRAGANDYLVKPFDPPHLIHRIEQVLARTKVERELNELRAELAAGRAHRRVQGRSPAMARAMDLVAAAARSRATVLLEGESGTGKELFAQEIHDASDRSRKPFIKLNCAALPEGLIESALFGHERGAFTGAIRRVEGAFERADGGTILLDEISEMRIDLQAKLLRVLQEREFERVGGSQPIAVDVRVIATTNRNLSGEVTEGRFRGDLYYRLNVIAIKVPPLRERPSDIPLLAQHFALQFGAEADKRIDSISPEAIDLLQHYAWPGNVRELQHVVERAVVLATTNVLDISAFDTVHRAVNSGDRTRLSAPTASATNPASITLPSLDLDAAEKALIDEALRRSGNNRTHAAALLGIGVRTLRKKLNAPESKPDSLE